MDCDSQFASVLVYVLYTKLECPVARPLVQLAAALQSRFRLVACGRIPASSTRIAGYPHTSGARALHMSKQAKRPSSLVGEGGWHC